MKKTMKKITVGLLFAVLISTVSMAGVACKKKEPVLTDEEFESLISAIYWEPVGEGAQSFCLKIKDNESVTAYYKVSTDCTTVGDALQKLGIIEGDESEYGLYIKSVNGISADFETDGAYWAFYVNDAYANSGVDSTEIKEGEIYSLVYTKA